MRKSIKKTSALCVAAALCLSAVGVALAYSPGTYVSITKSGGNLKFGAEVKTDAPSNYVDFISITTESNNEDTSKIISSYDWNTSGRSRIASTYALKNPIATSYRKWSHGIIEYIPDVPNQDYEDTVDTYYYTNRSSSKNAALIEERDTTIVQSFEIDLTDYNTIDPYNEDYFSEGLLQTRKQIDLKPGDTVPVTYISADRSHVYVTKQDAEGINYLFEFKKEDDKWILATNQETQGTKVYMPGMRSNEIEGGIEELDSSAEDFIEEPQTSSVPLEE